MKTTQYVQNLKCGGCAHTITEALLKIDGISEVLVNPELDSVMFTYERNDDLALVKDTLLQLGYPPSDEKNTLITKAKSLVSCAIGKVQSH